MKLFRITLLVPHVSEVLVMDAQAAHNEATRLAKANALDMPHGKAIVQSVEFVQDAEEAG
jgi:hypothetical protein